MYSDGESAQDLQRTEATWWAMKESSGVDGGGAGKLVKLMSRDVGYAWNSH